MSFRSAIIAANRHLQKVLTSSLNHEEGVPTFTWKGTEVPCVPSVAMRGLTLNRGPQMYTVSLVLLVLREEFLTVDTSLITVDSNLYTADNNLPTPVAGMSLVHNGRRYEIIQAGEDPARAYYSLVLADFESGR
jgi:hypothetical protein